MSFDTSTGTLDQTSATESDDANEHVDRASGGLGKSMDGSLEVPVFMPPLGAAFRNSLGRVLVDRINHGSPLLLAGVKPGCVLTAIGDQSIHPGICDAAVQMLNQFTSDVTGSFDSSTSDISLSFPSVLSFRRGGAESSSLETLMRKAHGGAAAPASALKSAATPAADEQKAPLHTTTIPYVEAARSGESDDTAAAMNHAAPPEESLAPLRAETQNATATWDASWDLGLEQEAIAAGDMILEVEAVNSDSASSWQPIGGSSSSGSEGGSAHLSDESSSGGGDGAAAIDGFPRELDVFMQALGHRVPAALAGHFLRAQGGSVEAAAAMYRATEEEFAELTACRRTKSTQSERANVALSPALDASIQDAANTSSAASQELHDSLAKQGRDTQFPMFEASPEAIAAATDEYEVSIESDKLGMTVENVLERTVVRAVSPGSAADKAGVETGSLLTSLGGQSCRSMSHFETIEQLRQAQRPLVLRLRRVEPERLQRRRAEMRALIHPQDAILNPRAAAASDALARRGFPVAESVARHNSYLSTVAELRPVHANSVNGTTTDSADAAGGAESEIAAHYLPSASLALAVGSVIGPDAVHGQPFDPEDPNAAVTAATAATAAIVSWAEERLLGVLRLLCVGQTIVAGADAADFPDAALSRAAHGCGSGDSDETCNKTVTLNEEGDVAAAEANTAGRNLPAGDRPADRYVPVLTAMQVVLEWNHTEVGGRVVGRRIEDMSAVLDALAAVIDWRDEAVRAVEHDLRELLCLLLDVDRNFDLTSATYPGVLGGAVSVLLRELVLHLDEEQLCTQMVPLVQRLAVSQSVTSRVACCGIVPLVYGGLPLPQQLQLRGVLSRFVHDITASVRKEAAEAIQAVADVADSSAVSWLLLLCERAACDAEFSVRRVAVGTCLHLANKLPSVLSSVQAEEGKISLSPVTVMGKSFAVARAYHREAHLLQCKLLPIVTRLAEDADWQVRLAVARHCDCLCAALGAHWTAVMVDILQMLLRDVDMEVRCEAVHCLPRLAHAMLQLAGEGASGGAHNNPSSLGIERIQGLRRTVPAAAPISAVDSSQESAEAAAAPSAGAEAAVELTGKAETESSGGERPELDVGQRAAAATSGEAEVTKGSREQCEPSECIGNGSSNRFRTEPAGSSGAAFLGPANSSLLTANSDYSRDSAVSEDVGLTARAALGLPECLTSSVTAPEGPLTVAPATEAEFLAQAMLCAAPGEDDVEQSPSSTTMNGAVVVQSAEMGTAAERARGALAAEASGMAPGGVEARSEPAMDLLQSNGTDSTCNGSGVALHRAAPNNSPPTAPEASTGPSRAARDAWLGAQARVLDALVPPVTKVVNDKSPEVRAALASAVGDLLRLVTGPWADAVTPGPMQLMPQCIDRLPSMGLPSIGEGEVYNLLAPPAIALAERASTPPGSVSRAPLPEAAIAQWVVDEMLVPLARQLLQDIDSQVACAMLQGLRPAAAAARGSSAWMGAAASGGGGAVAAVAAVECSSGQASANNAAGPGAGGAVGAVVVSGHSDILFATPASRASSEDEHSGSRARLHMPPLLTASQVASVLEPIERLATSKEWRVRQAAVEALPALDGGAMEPALQARICSLLGHVLEDPVDAVRRAAAEHACVAAKAGCDRCPSKGVDCPLGCSSWLRYILLPQLHALQAAKSFRSRMLVMHTVQSMISVGLATYELVQNVIVPAVSRAAGDPLANVRMSAARVVEVLAAWQQRCARPKQPAVTDALASLATELRADSDRDVAYFANRAMALLSFSPYRGGTSEARRDGRQGHFPREA